MKGVKNSFQEEEQTSQNREVQILLTVQVQMPGNLKGSDKDNWEGLKGPRRVKEKVSRGPMQPLERPEEDTH